MLTIVILLFYCHVVWSRELSCTTESVAFGDGRFPSPDCDDHDQNTIDYCQISGDSVLCQHDCIDETLCYKPQQLTGAPRILTIILASLLGACCCFCCVVYGIIAYYHIIIRKAQDHDNENQTLLSKQHSLHRYNELESYLYQNNFEALILILSNPNALFQLEAYMKSKLFEPRPTLTS